MSEKQSDQNTAPALRPQHDGQRHLRLLRAWLARDPFASDDWRHVLMTLAQMTREGLLADQGLVAIQRSTGWWLTDASGQQEHFDHHVDHAWRPVFDHLLEQPEPLLDPRLEVEPGSIIALPLMWRLPQRPDKALGGCLCAKRIPARESFNAIDVELGLDLARLAQPHLGRLARLHPPPLPLGATPTTSREALNASLRAFLREQISCHEGNVSAMTRDPVVRQRLGYTHTSLPISTLNRALKTLDLIDDLQREREHQRARRLDRVIEAIRTHRNGSAAARALGISRDALVWQLRKAGLTIRAVLKDS